MKILCLLNFCYCSHMARNEETLGLQIVDINNVEEMLNDWGGVLFWSTDKLWEIHRLLMIQLESVVYLPICQKRKKAQEERQLKIMKILSTNGMQLDVQCLACHIIVSMLCLYISVLVSVLLLEMIKSIHCCQTGHTCC